LHTCAFNDEINFEKFRKVVKNLRFIGILIGFFSPNGSIMIDLTIETGLCHPANSPLSPPPPTVVREDHRNKKHCCLAENKCGILLRMRVYWLILPAMVHWIVLKKHHFTLNDFYQGDFLDFLCTLFNTASSAPRFHCVGGC
jgi:hypothetical protein